MRGGGNAARGTSWARDVTTEEYLRMRLADFILANIEPILVEWESFARSLAAGAKMDPAALRDHAEEMLRAAARDMLSAQTATEQSDKSRGHGRGEEHSLRVNGAAAAHASERAASGFDLLAVMAEYRALRASVVRLWRGSKPDPDARDVDDLTRFHESIDQSLAQAVLGYTKRLDRSRQMFLAILGHDLRSPLNSMAMWAEVLLREAGKADADPTEAASQIQSSAIAMGRMIRDLLDFTGAALGGTMPIKPAAMDLAALCREVVAEVQAGDPSCTLRFEPRGDPRGEWDAARLRQLVSNLIGNAIQHGAERCAVDLSLDGEGSQVALAVHNQGPPIPPELLPTIFDPLVRGVPSAPTAATAPAGEHRAGAVHRPRGGDRARRHDRRHLIRRGRNSLHRPSPAPRQRGPRGPRGRRRLAGAARHPAIGDSCGPLWGSRHAEEVAFAHLTWLHYPRPHASS
jgi:hypothetical protein